MPQHAFGNDTQGRFAWAPADDRVVQPHVFHAFPAAAPPVSMSITQPGLAFPAAVAPRSVQLPHTYVPYVPLVHQRTGGRPSSRYDGLIGLAIGLLVLTVPISGALTLDAMARRAEARAARTAATTAPAQPAAVPATDSTFDAAAVPEAEWSTEPPPSGTSAPAPRERGKQAQAPATSGQGAAQTRAQRLRAWQQANRARQLWYQQQAQRQGAHGGGAATSSGATRPPSAPTGGGSTTVRPPARPATTGTGTTQPAPAPQVQPTPAAPTSYSVSTPGGAKWTIPPAELDAVRAGVPNATIVANA